MNAFFDSVVIRPLLHEVEGLDPGAIDQFLVFGVGEWFLLDLRAQVNIWAANLHRCQRTLLATAVETNRSCLVGAAVEGFLSVLNSYCGRKIPPGRNKLEAQGGGCHIES